MGAIFWRRQRGVRLRRRGSLELGLWVRADYCGQGIGQSTIRELKAEALHRGITRASLSVEEGNYAGKLYEEEGFVAVAGREKDGVML